MPPSLNPCRRRYSRVSRVLLALIGVSLLGAITAQAQSTEPLPDAHAVALEVRRRALTDRELQSQYTFIEKREEIDVSMFGKVKKGPTKTYEVYPSAEPGNTYKRLVAINGTPLSAAELDKQDRKHRDDILREMEKRQHEPASERAKRQAREAKERAERDAMLDEVLLAYDMTLVGRETIAGHRALVATLVPKPGYKPRTEAGRLMKKMRAKVWVSEADYQIIRGEGEMIDDVTLGWGIAGRLYKGSRAVFERIRVNGEVWLPSRQTFTGNGRALLFRKFAVDTVTTFSDYKKFTVNTEERASPVQ